MIDYRDQRIAEVEDMPIIPSLKEVVKVFLVNLPYVPKRTHVNYFPVLRPDVKAQNAYILIPDKEAKESIRILFYTCETHIAIDFFEHVPSSQYVGTRIPVTQVNEKLHTWYEEDELEANKPLPI